MSLIMIATPCYGGMIHETYLKSLMGSIGVLQKNKHSFIHTSFGNESLITRARNNLTAIFLGSKADALMFIDADIGWTPQALLDLIEASHAVSGIPYPKKGYDWNKIKDLIEKDWDKKLELTPQSVQKQAVRYAVDVTRKSTLKLDPGWVEVDHLGTGFMLIQRNVIESMKAFYWDQLNYKNDVTGYINTAKPEHCVGLFETMIDPETKRYLSEDYAFCKRWRDIGGHVIACTKHKLTHTGTHTF